MSARRSAFLESSACSEVSKIPIELRTVALEYDESDPEGGRCVRCDRFDGFPCLTDGKADAHVLCVRPAVKRENVTLRTHARVTRTMASARRRSSRRGSSPPSTARSGSGARSCRSASSAWSVAATAACDPIQKRQRFSRDVIAASSSRSARWVPAEVKVGVGAASKKSDGDDDAGANRSIEGSLRQFLQNAAEASEYCYSATLWTPQAKYPGAKDFFDNFKKKYNKEADYHGAEAYAAAYVLADTLKRAKGMGPEELRASLAAPGPTSRR